MLDRLLDVFQRDAQYELGMIRGCSVRLEWLRSKFFDVNDADSPICITCCAKHFCWWGALYLLIRAGREYPSCTSHYLRTLVGSHRMSGELLPQAYLYKQLGYASKTNVKRIPEFLLLFEV